MVGDGQQGTKHVWRIPDEAFSTYILIQSLILMTAEEKYHTSTP